MKIKDLTPLKDANPFHYVKMYTWLLEHVIGNYNQDKESMEYEGDLQELNDLIVNYNYITLKAYERGLTSNDGTPIRGILDKTHLEKFISVAAVLKQFWDEDLMNFNEASKLPGSFKLIRENYPTLWKTAIVWAWG